MPIDPNRLYNIVILVPARPASGRVSARLLLLYLRAQRVQCNSIGSPTKRLGSAGDAELVCELRHTWQQKPLDIA